MPFYKLLRGGYADGPVGKEHQYRKGDFVETKPGLELDKIFGGEKFRKVTRQEMAAAKNATGDGLEGLDLKELRKFAEEEEVDLGSATKKEDIIGAIRGALQLN